MRSVWYQRVGEREEVDGCGKSRHSGVCSPEEDGGTAKQIGEVEVEVGNTAG